MGTILSLLANPIVMRVVLGLIDAFLANKKADDATKEAVKKLAEFMRKNGVEKAKSRFEAEDQIAAGDDMWNQRENPPKPEEKKS
jgi:hypothetical protein